MKPFTDLRRRDESAFGDALPAGLRSEAFAEDLAGLLAPAPVPLAVAQAAGLRGAAAVAVPRSGLARLARLAMPARPLGA